MAFRRGGRAVTKMHFSQIFLQMFMHFKSFISFHFQSMSARLEGNDGIPAGGEYFAATQILLCIQ